MHTRDDASSCFVFFKQRRVMRQPGVLQKSCLIRATLRVYSSARRGTLSAFSAETSIQMITCNVLVEDFLRQKDQQVARLLGLDKTI